MPKEEREEGEKGSEEKGILGKLKKLVMPETEKREEVRTEEVRVSEARVREGAPVETKASEVKTGEAITGERKAGEMKPSEEKPSEEKPSEEKPSEMRSSEMKAGEMRPSEMRPREMRPSEMRPSEMRATEPKHAGTAGRPYTYEFYHEIGKRGGEERAREIREEGISPEVHEKLSAAGKKGGPRGGEATKRKHGHESLEEHKKEHGG